MVMTERMRRLCLEVKPGSWGAQRLCQARAASSHPLCLSWSLGCQIGAGMVRDPLGPGQPVGVGPGLA